MVSIRYFAAAKAATGRRAEDRPAAGLTIGALLDDVAREVDAPDAAAVLARCSFLVNASATTDRSRVLADGDTLDVLPPFAGG